VTGTTRTLAVGPVLVNRYR